MKNYYQILEVHPKARKEVIQASYRVLAKFYHPDSDNGNKEIMLDVNEAYEVLTSQSKRKAYDEKYNAGQYDGVVSLEMQALMRELNIKEKEILRREKVLLEKEERLNTMREKEKKAKKIKKDVELEDKVGALCEDATPLNKKYSYLKDIIGGGRKSIPFLKKALLKTSGENKYFIVQAIAEIGPDDDELFIDLLNDDYALIRGEALRVLGDIKAVSASRYVVLLFEDKESSVREEACNAAFKLGYEGASDGLLELCLNKKEDRRVRLAALKALSRCAGISKKEQISVLTSDKDKEVCSQAEKTVFLLEQKEIFLSRKTGSF